MASASAGACASAAGWRCGVVPPRASRCRVTSPCTDGSRNQATHSAMAAVGSRPSRASHHSSTRSASSNTPPTALRKSPVGTTTRLLWLTQHCNSTLMPRADGPAMRCPSAPVDPAVRLHRVAQLPWPVDLAPQRAHGHLGPVGQLRSRPVPLPLQQGQQPRVRELVFAMNQSLLALRLGSGACGL